MQKFIEKYREQINGVLSGFDRLVFRGTIRKLNFSCWDEKQKAMVAVGMEQYLGTHHILYKDYRQHVQEVSERVKQASVKPFMERSLAVEYLRDPSAAKEEIARAKAAAEGIASGLVCALGSTELSPSFEHRGTHIVRRVKPCHVVYHYQVHDEVGWMYARLQTWFPFNIQVGLNGREWLARQMDRAGLKYRQEGNCFVWIEDYEEAQRLLKEQLKIGWADLLNGFARQLNPLHEELFEKYPADYYWTCYQSEWASDIIFKRPEFLRRLMVLLTRHGMLSFQSADVLRFFGKRVNQTGSVPGNFSGTLEADLKRRQQGERVKYRMNGNSAKFYDKAYSEVGSVLRGAETTINDVGDFRVYRPKEGGAEDDLQWRRMRKGIADLHRRAEVSQKANERLLDALGCVDDSRSIQELTESIQTPVCWAGRRVRALRPWAEDEPLLTAIGKGEFLLNGFRNRDLQALLYQGAVSSRTEGIRRSAAISRRLRMLRAHGLIQKVPRTHRYQVTEAGRLILVTLATAARTTLQQLNQIQRAA